MIKVECTLAVHMGANEHHVNRLAQSRMQHHKRSRQCTEPKPRQCPPLNSLFVYGAPGGVIDLWVGHCHWVRWLWDAGGVLQMPRRGRPMAW